MREGEYVKAYAERHWETFNKIDGDFDEVAIRTFKVGLPSEHDLRKSLTGKPVTSLRQLMDRVDKYKRIEDDQQQGKGKAKVNCERPRPRPAFFIRCWAKPMWMGGVMLLPLKMEVRPVIFFPLD